MLGQGPTHNQLEAEATAEARYPTSRSQTLPGHSRPFATLPVTWAETPLPWIMNGHFCRHLGAVLTITPNPACPPLSQPLFTAVSLWEVFNYRSLFFQSHLLLPSFLPAAHKILLTLSRNVNSC